MRTLLPPAGAAPRRVLFGAVASIGTALQQSCWRPDVPAANGAGYSGNRDAMTGNTEPAGGLPTLGLYRPSFPDDLSAVAGAEAGSGQRSAIVHWYALWGGWKRDFRPDDLRAVAARGSLPMITWEPWAGTAADPAWTLRRAVLSGRHDSYVDGWARGLAAFGRPVLLRFAHEMHDHPGYPWAVGVNGNTAEDYLAAWRHIRRRFAQQGANNVQWVWGPNCLGAAGVEEHERIYRRLYPGDDEVDWVGLDVFNTGPGLDWGAPYWRPFEDALAAPYAAVGRVSRRPILLAEVGCAEQGGSKADWIRRALAPETLRAFPNVRALVWFDTPKEQPWHLDSSGAARSAWTAAVAAVAGPAGGADQAAGWATSTG